MGGSGKRTKPLVGAPASSGLVGDVRGLHDKRRIIHKATTVSTKPVPTTSWWIYLLEGIGAILVGILLLTAPGRTVVAITLFLGWYWLFVGVLELARAFVDRSVPWYWSLLIGLLGIAAGLMVLNHPLLAAAVLPATLVIYLGVLGILIGSLAIIGGFTGGGIGSFILLISSSVSCC
jgi:uncharacterized membrane protein HdeD (DUF308 family)